MVFSERKHDFVCLPSFQVTEIRVPVKEGLIETNRCALLESSHSALRPIVVGIFKNAIQLGNLMI